jgi:hypothetical protein
VEAELRVPTPERPNVDALREALITRAADLKRTLRAEPRVARLISWMKMGFWISTSRLTLPKH